MLLALGDGGLLDDLLALGEDELDVARVVQEGIDLFALVGYLMSFMSSDKRTRPWAR